MFSFSRLRIEIFGKIANRKGDFMKILLVEDNESIVKGLEYSFTKENCEVVSKDTVRGTREYLNEYKPDLIILDISLPDGNGLSLYENTIKDLEIPTIFLTAQDDEEMVVKGLDIGAEDYITKPFSTKELIARAKKIYARNKKETVVKVEDVEYDLDKMTVSKNGKVIELTSLELKILNLFFQNIGRVITRETILNKIWEWTGNDVDDHTVTVYIKRIREKIGVALIKTLKGIGYRVDGK